MSKRLTRGWLVRAGIASAMGAAAIIATVTFGGSNGAQAACGFPSCEMTMAVSPATQNVAVGSAVNITIQTTDPLAVTTWGGYSMELGYNPAILGFVSVINTPAICPNASWGNPTAPANSPIIQTACFGQSSTATGTEETIQLQCNAVGSTALHLITLGEDPVNGSTYFDENAVNIPTALTDGVVNCVLGQQKSHAGGATLIAGTTVTYTIHVDGPSSGVSVHGLAITDQLPSPPLSAPFTVASTFGVADGCTVSGTGFVSCPTLSSDVGTGNTITVTAAIPLSAAGANNVCNQSMGVTGVANSNIDCFNVAPSHLTVTKVANGGPFQSGDPFTWTVTVVSDGGSPAAGVIVSDTATDGYVISGSTGTVKCPANPTTATTATFNCGTLSASDGVQTFTISGNESDPNPSDNTCNNQVQATSTNGPASNTAAASVVCASKNVRMVKDTDNPSNLNDDPQLANLFLCVGPTCTSNGMGYLDITENIVNIGSDPQGVGAFEFQVKYDNHIFDITICEGDAAAPAPNNGCVPLGPTATDGPSHWLYSSGRIPGAAGIGGCAATIITENDIRYGCVSKENPATGGPGCLSPDASGATLVLNIECGPKNDGIAATLHVTPKADLSSRITPGNDNGAIRTLLDEGCEVADIWGHPLSAANGNFDPSLHAPNNGYDALGREIPLPGIAPGGQVTDCGDITITVRVLEGDMNKDCVVDVSDDQIEASHYGAFFGVLLYQPWYDLEPALKDGDVDIKDLQKVFGRNGSMCSSPIPPQPPLPDPDP